MRRRCGRPRAAWYCTASFSATSTLTDPESAKNTCCSSGGVNSTNDSASSTAGRWVSPPNITCAKFPICSTAARSNSGLRYPCTAHHHEAIPSIASTRSPSGVTSVSVTPCAAATV